MLLSTIIVGIVGAVLASFAVTTGYRLVSGQSIGDRSVCNECGSIVAWHLLIPVVGYAAGLGICAECRARIPVRYMMFELCVGMMFVLVYSRGIASSESAKLLVLILVLAACTETDLVSRTIPNRLLLIAFSFHLIMDAWSLQNGPISYTYLYGLLGLILGSAIRIAGTTLFGSAGLGMGDIKLLGIIGLFAGQLLIPTLFIAILLAAILGSAGIITKRIERKTLIPFAPFLATGLGTAYLIGDNQWLL